ncbi:MAG TPA: hypothetical protein VL282_05130 [Tepidisphaeraceae bacterium]|nr:hypothetical protein [Tepidisphaeraceae bacterium]
MIRRKIKSLAVAALVGLGVSNAKANFTTCKPPPAGEASQMDILNHAYGANFHKVGDDYYDGTLTAKRVDDNMTFTGPMSLNTGLIGDATDQSWCANAFHAKTLAAFSYNTQQFGCMDSGGYHGLFDVSGFGYDASGEATHNMNGATFNFARTGNSGTQSSLTSFNSDARDHVVTFEISGLAGQDCPIWVLFWEDLNLTSDLPLKRSWADYNDLCVQITKCDVAAVPLPPAAWAGLVTMAGMGIVRGRKKIASLMA